MSSTAVTTNHQLAQLLEDQHLLPPEILAGLVNHAKLQQEWVGQVAVDDGLLSYEELAVAIAREMRLPMVNLRTFPPNQRAMECLSAPDCRTYCAVPLALQHGKLLVAMANPLDESGKNMLQKITRCAISVQVAPANAILKAVDEWYARMPAISSTVSANDMHIPSEMSSPKTEAIRQVEQLCLEDLLVTMMEHRASDLHLSAGSPPLMRVDGELQPLPFSVLTPPAIQSILYAILTDVQITTFERNWELDFSYSLPGLSRFRVNLHRQRGSAGGVIRIIPMEVPNLDGLKMPPIIREFTQRPRGLVLITGPTGAGKSTTLAAMVDEINRTSRRHIITIEDPIEFLHNNRMSVVTQREVGSDTESFATALRHVFRQDPDVLLIGEMRDRETIAAALTAAETGHLVLASLHTTSAAQTVDRIVDVFPETQQDQVRSQLSNVLEGIITQTLLPRADGKGRICAQEIMIASSAIRTLIRDNKVHQMPNVIQASAKFGMQTLETALGNLVVSGQVTFDEALKKTSSPDDFKAFIALQ